MIKIEDSFNSICCNTRLRYQFNKDKSKFTASDIEIFTDLHELKLVADRSAGNSNSGLVNLDNLPQKRKKTISARSESLVVHEDEVVSALTSLFSKKSEKIVLNDNLNSNKKTFDSNLNELINAISYYQKQEVKNSIWKKCGNPGGKKSNCIKSKKIIKNKTQNVMRLFD